MDFSEITDSLLIGTTPRTHDYPLLRELQVSLVINMRVERWPYPDLHEKPLRVLWLPTIDYPLFPIPIRALRRGVQAALKAVNAGGKVYVHCAKGVHRSVAMGAAVLIAQGQSPQDAMSLILERRQVADPHAWYIRRRILLFDKSWKKTNGGLEKLLFQGE